MVGDSTLRPQPELIHCGGAVGASQLTTALTHSMTHNTTAQQQPDGAHYTSQNWKWPYKQKRTNKNNSRSIKNEWNKSTAPACISWLDCIIKLDSWNIILAQNNLLSPSIFDHNLPKVLSGGTNRITHPRCFMAMFCIFLCSDTVIGGCSCTKIQL